MSALEKGVEYVNYTAEDDFSDYEMGTPVIIGTTSEDVLLPTNDDQLVAGFIGLDVPAGKGIPIAVKGTILVTVGAEGATKGALAGLSTTQVSSKNVRLMDYNSAVNNMVLGVFGETGTVGQRVPLRIEFSHKTA